MSSKESDLDLLSEVRVKCTSTSVDQRTNIRKSSRYSSFEFDLNCHWISGQSGSSFQGNQQLELVVPQFNATPLTLTQRTFSEVVLVWSGMESFGVVCSGREWNGVVWSRMKSYGVVWSRPVLKNVYAPPTTEFW